MLWRNFCGPPGATLKIFDTLWRYRLYHQKFFDSERGCLIRASGKRKTATKVNASTLKPKNFTPPRSTTPRGDLSIYEKFLSFQISIDRLGGFFACAHCGDYSSCACDYIAACKYTFDRCHVVLIYDYIAILIQF